MRKSFGTYQKFYQSFIDAAMGVPVGWVWLSQTPTGLRVVSTKYHESPLTHGQRPLVGVDVWEHSYYLDYQHDRGRYVANWLKHLINWDFAEQNFRPQ
jgi:Fe-Mn family superoxide dismutase